MGREICVGRLPNFGLTSFSRVYYTDITQYITLCPPPDSAQRYDFTGLTPNDYMDMDLSPIFGLNPVLGRFWGGSARLRTGLLTFAEQLVYQRVLGCGFSDFLEDSAPALPVIARSGVIVALGALPVCENGHDMM